MSFRDNQVLDTRGTAVTATLEQPSAPREGRSTSENSQRLRDEFNSYQLSESRLRAKSRWIPLLENFKAFLLQIKDLVCYERINILLVFVPVGIAVGFVDPDPIVDFIFNALAIIPLAVIISTATESLAARLGDTFGALLNVTVGNAAELIIFFTALAKDQIRIVKGSLLGSVLANSLLVLGTANVCGGLRFGAQLHDRAAGRLSVCLLNLGLGVALFPV